MVGIIKVGWIEGKSNLADLFTKTTILSPQGDRWNFVQNIFKNQCSFGKLVVGREKRGPLVICDQCNWWYNHDVIMGFNTIIRTRTLEFTLE